MFCAQNENSVGFLHFVSVQKSQRALLTLNMVKMHLVLCSVSCYFIKVLTLNPPVQWNEAATPKLRVFLSNLMSFLSVALLNNKSEWYFCIITARMKITIQKQQHFSTCRKNIRVFEDKDCTYRLIFQQSHVQ